MKRSLQNQMQGVTARRCWVTTEIFGDSVKSKQAGDKIGLRV